MNEEDLKNADEYLGNLQLQRIEKLKYVGFTEEQAVMLLDIIKSISLSGGLF